jgi:N-acetyl-gamma-glutamyl-phosphate reductase
MQIEPLDMNKLAELADVVLCCLPHKVSMGFVPKLLDGGLKVIDFSADYRIKDVNVYEKFYQKHTDTDNLVKAVYGLPELFRDEIKGKNLVANPGCFPTGFMLAIAPLLKNDLIETDSIINNAVTGTSGAGKNLSTTFHFPNMNENFFAYGIGAHRHMPEMEEVASTVAGSDVTVLFQPHVGPFDRGILSSVYCKPKKSISNEDMIELYNDFYKDKTFVQVCDGSPKLKDVAGTNYCHVYPTNSRDMLVAFSGIDNLAKGASSQAIQNMNIIFDMDETLGLK